ncbi:hypothetical protein CGCF415_v009911 [Colletotrichum fructicola]|uniref:Uncharacterized protein n=2 Tax=Colletotrichum gloeosporioides species complex TaxID=2707338 RepID=A0A7J6II10_COLFN|nr:uncharacterized protein CGMCC3_g2599 [Colletotrichum fructicola]KAF4476267.1 hypothetical protein CGGC5_v014547 [Colletotrichum fructicola Nara gc5]KAK1838939.1 hypothetical protein CCHR01_18435 [Colletotrichum chrysophilum]KAE9581514.1 hypothetical protein CGMCC3_g2599 [Colletotrichum fructicola]KAF4433178.1 hypothetical protein CFRS1_v010501 [Colletotrichum fructicola]KAF4887859.1 hypothetical protein CGCFRS4_v010293 [Colletotrichum fructicola]
MASQTSTSKPLPSVSRSSNTHGTAQGCLTDGPGGNNPASGGDNREQPSSLSHAALTKHNFGIDTNIHSVEEDQRRDEMAVIRNLVSLGLTLDSKVAQKVARNTHGMSPMERFMKEIQETANKIS